MAINSYLTDKKYVDFNALRALILQIKTIDDARKDDIKDLDDALKIAIARLDEIYIKGENGAADTGLLATAIADIAQIRKELGDTPADFDPANNIYARLTRLESTGNDYADRLKALEDYAAGAAVDLNYTAGTGTIAITMYKSKALADAGGDKTKVADADKVTATISSKDFVVNGMIDSAALVTIDNNLKATDGAGNVLPYTVPADIAVDGNKGKKFLVLQFNTSVQDVEGKKDVWIPADALFDDYDFHTVNTDTDYVKVDVKEVHGAPADDPNTGDVNEAVNNVTITAALGDKAKDAFALTEGTKPKDPNNASAGNYKGIVDLNTAVDKNATDIAALQKTVDGDAQGADDKAKKGLVGRTADLEGYVKDGWDNAGTATKGLLDRTTDIENWLNGTGVLPALVVKQLWELTFDGETSSAQLSDDFPRVYVNDKNFGAGNTITIAGANAVVFTDKDGAAITTKPEEGLFITNKADGSLWGIDTINTADKDGNQTATVHKYKLQSTSGK